MGVASPKAQGQAIISTATKFKRAVLIELSEPRTIHPIKVVIAIIIIVGTNTAETVSANL